MQDGLWKLEERQVGGAFGLVAIGIIAALGEHTLHDLLGFVPFLLFAPLVLFPRRWLSLAFLFPAAYLGFLGVRSMQYYLDGVSKNSWLFPAACLLTAVLLSVCALVKSLQPRTLP